jgi:hypothetical protein
MKTAESIAMLSINNLPCPCWLGCIAAPHKQRQLKIVLNALRHHCSSGSGCDDGSRTTAYARQRHQIDEDSVRYTFVKLLMRPAPAAVCHHRCCVRCWKAHQMLLCSGLRLAILRCCWPLIHCRCHCHSPAAVATAHRRGSSGSSCHQGHDPCGLPAQCEELA